MAPDSKNYFFTTFSCVIYLSWKIVSSTKLVTSLDDIKVHTNPKYMNGNVEIIYFGKNHYEYLVNIDQNIVRNISNVYVS